ncbi:hypothetical protein BGZ97_000367 [Linnemannia gamsii]|uniref:Uncharacterized protein n=1 Tax=Linnemannia gamsii TaxID=64522 RepID=A0A9P6QYC7_9FUNG|nr:hypothetical protein BGZ97_000367 [Linnemannia gamsii]
MLAPTNNISTAGSSSDVLMNSQSISSRAPQDRYNQIDDNTHSSAVIAPSPQVIHGDAAPLTYTDDNSPYRTPSVIRNPNVQPYENSPSVSHPRTNSSVLSSNYIPPPSPTPSQLNACPVPEGHYNQAVYPSPGGTYQHQYQQYQQTQYQQQNMFQDPYQQTYQQTYQQHQPYPEPTLHSYSEPELVDTVDEKPRPSSAGSFTKPTNNGRRKKIIWIGAIVTLILIGAIIGIMVSMKNKDSDNKDGNSSNNSSSGGNSSKTSSPTPTPTAYSSGRPATSIFVTVPSTPVTVSLIPVTIPTPTGGRTVPDILL